MLHCTPMSRNKTIGVQVTQETYAQLQLRLTELGVNTSVYLRQLIAHDLGANANPFGSGWSEGYRQAYADVLHEFSAAIGRIQDQATQGKSTT